MDVLFFGGDKRDRTADLLNAIQALSRVTSGAPPTVKTAENLENLLLV